MATTLGTVNSASGSNIVDKLDATTAPGVTDDSNAKYKVGSKWVDVVADTVYVCVDATIGAAVWKDVSATGGSGSGGYSTYTETRSSGLQWDVTHGLDADRVEIVANDESGNIVTPTSIKHFDKNRVVIYFDRVVSGYVTCKAIPVVYGTLADAKISDWVSGKVTTRNSFTLKPNLEVVAGFRVDDGAGVTYPNADITFSGAQDQPEHIALSDDKFITATVTKYEELTYGLQERLTLYINQFNRTTGKIDTLSYWIPDNTAYGTGTGYNAEEDSVHIKMINATTLLVCSYEQSEADAGALVLIARTFNIAGDTFSLIGEAIAVNGVYGALYDNRTENTQILALFGISGAMVSDINGIVPIVFDGSFIPSFAAQVPYDLTFSGGMFDNGTVESTAAANLNATQVSLAIHSEVYIELRVVNWNGGALTFGAATKVPNQGVYSFKGPKLTEMGADRVAFNTTWIDDEIFDRQSKVYIYTNNGVTLDFEGSVLVHTAAASNEDDRSLVYLGEESGKLYISSVNAELGEDVYPVLHRTPANAFDAPQSNWRPTVASVDLGVVTALASVTHVPPVLTITSVSANGGVTGVTITSGGTFAGDGKQIYTTKYHGQSDWLKSIGVTFDEAEVECTIVGGTVTGVYITHAGVGNVNGDSSFTPSRLHENNTRDVLNTNHDTPTFVAGTHLTSANFAIGDTLTVVGGTFTTVPTTFTVTNVSAGTITNGTWVTGDYTVLPSNPVSLAIGVNVSATGTISMPSFDLYMSYPITGINFVETSVPDSVKSRLGASGIGFAPNWLIGSKIPLSNLGRRPHYDYASAGRTTWSINPIDVSSGLPSLVSFDGTIYLTPFSDYDGPTYDVVSKFNNAHFFNAIASWGYGYTVSTAEYDLTAKVQTNLKTEIVEASYNELLTSTDIENGSGFILNKDLILFGGMSYRDYPNQVAANSYFREIQYQVAHTGTTGTAEHSDKFYNVCSPQFWEDDLPNGVTWTPNGELHVDPTFSGSFNLTPKGWGANDHKPKYNFQVGAFCDVQSAGFSFATTNTATGHTFESGSLTALSLQQNSNGKYAMVIDYAGVTMMPVTGYSSDYNWHLAFTGFGGAEQIIIDRIYVAYQ